MFARERIKYKIVLFPNTLVSGSRIDTPFPPNDIIAVQHIFHDSTKTFNCIFSSTFYGCHISKYEAQYCLFTKNFEVHWKNDSNDMRVVNERKISFCKSIRKLNAALALNRLTLTHIDSVHLSHLYMLTNICIYA